MASSIGKGFTGNYADAENGWVASMNENLALTVDGLPLDFAQDRATTTGLTYGYVGGVCIAADGVVTVVADGTVALTDNTTNYVERDRTGSVSANTSEFTPGSLPMAEVVTASGAITSVTDRRTFAAQGPTLAGATFTGPVEVPDDAYDATAWNGNTEVPTKNAIRNKIETLGGGAPSGPAGGVLSGTYPDPGFAVDMATQAELDAAVAALKDGVSASFDTLAEIATTLTDHHTRHESGGADAIQLDNLAAPDDNTDLNATSSAHGLLKKLGTSGQRLKSDGTNQQWVDDYYTVPFIIDGGGAVISTGLKGGLQVDVAGTIVAATVLALDGNSGSVVVDIWKDTYANHPPTVADTITASAKPTVSSATKATDSTLTGWTTSIAAGDILFYNVDSVTTFTRILVSLKVKKP